MKRAAFMVLSARRVSDTLLPRRRRFLADMLRFTAAFPLWSHGMAQQRVPHIGFMSGAEPSLIASFEDEMRSSGTPRAGTSISKPLVIITCPGMVSNGFAESLERPGGIYTGMDELPPGVTRKRLLLLKRAAPAVSRIALLSTTPGRGGHETQLADAEQTARAWRIKFSKAGGREISRRSIPSPTSCT